MWTATKNLNKVWILLAAVVLLPVTALAAEAGAGEGTSVMHRMMVLVIQLGVILFAAKLGNILFEKMHLPGVLGELVAGMVIGPYCLGRLGFYGFEHGLFATHGGQAVTPELYGITSVASVVLLFVIGLETDLGLMLRYSVAGTLVGAGGVLVSLVAGCWLGVIFSQSLVGTQQGWLSPMSLFLGIACTATSVGITARILSEKRKLEAPEGVTILSAAVIDDVIGIILLAIVMGIVTASKSQSGGVDWGHIGLVAIKAVGVWLTATVLGLLASRRISFLLKWFQERTAIAVMAMGLALVLAGLFEEAGLAMIIGAYVMGLSLSQADISYMVRERLRPIYELLVPVFFCVMGMQINLGVLGNKTVVIFGLTYAGVSFLAKLVGCGLPALLANFNLRGATRIGVGMAPRGEVGLIIAGIGLQAGMLTNEMFAAVIVMVVLNTIVPPPILVLLFRGGASGTRKAVLAEEKPKAEIVFDLPSETFASFMMDELADVFESEGFFVHQLSHEPRLHQLRKDRAVIDVVCSGLSLTFRCGQSEVPLVNAAMYEAVAALENATRELRKPHDAGAIQMRLQEQAQFGPGGLNMRHVLTPALIVPELRAGTKEQVIDELLDVLENNGLLKDRKQARRAVWEREESMSTGLQYGVAIPHGKTDEVDRLVCAIGVKHDGIDFNAMDSKPSTVFILTLSPKRKPAPHVQFMSTISQVLNEAGRNRVLASRTAREICEVFTSPPAKEAAAPAATPRRFSLARYLRAEHIQPRLEGVAKEEVIEELLGLLDAGGVIRDIATARQAVLAREKEMSTALGEGVAIPHGRTDAVSHLACAVGIQRDGVDFGSPDGEPSRIFVLVLTPKEGADPYLQFVASLMEALDASGRQKLLAACSREEMYRVLAGGNAS